MSYPVMPLGFLGSQGDQDSYRIERSLRFNSADSAYLSRTPASAGNRKTWTWSGWVKRSSLIAVNNGHAIFSASGSGSNYTDIRFEDDQIRFDIEASGQTRVMVITSPYYRDFSAWYHLVVAFDSTQATASNRVRIYINGVQQTTTNTINQNIDSAVNQAVAHNIGRRVAGSDHLLNAYLTEIHLVDGQVLTPSEFAETDAITGRWKAKAYSGTYGTNGFYLKFADNSGTTATTLGKDSSGNGNNWTPNNFSVTAGAGNDSLVDSPTNYGTDTGVGGEVRGNYATFNPLETASGLSDGNLRYTGQGSSRNANFLVTSGKWYFEGTVVSIGGATERMSIFYSNLEYRNTGQKSVSGVVSNYGSSFTTNDIIGVAINWENTTATFYKNGVSQGALSFTSDTLGYISFYAFNTSDIWAINFGQRPFAYTAPSGFKALCTTNLPQPTIQKPSRYMDVVTWTGNGSASQDITGLSFSPDLVWLKSRTDGYDHRLKDSTRGNFVLFSNLTNAEVAYSLDFLSNGIRPTLGYNDNISSKQYVAWAWDRAAIDGLDIVSYSGNSSTQNVSHGLGVAPSMIIVKTYSPSVDAGEGNWCVYHRSLGSNKFVYLDLTNAAVTSTTIWNNTAPTASVFSLGNDNNVNKTGKTQIAYCFSEVEGFSKFGSYTGNLSSDGPFIWCGFRPRYVMVKGDSVSNWNVFDAVRGNVNPNQTILRSNLANSEIDGVSATAGVIDFLSNGFKMRGSYGDTNANSTTFIFAAFAEAPFKYARAR